MSRFKYSGVSVIPGYSQYAISIDGDVYNLKTCKQLRPFNVSDGYRAVRLHRDGTGRNFYVHRLLMEIFVGQPPGPTDWTVDHIDGDKANNQFSNLRWLSRGDNLREMMKRRMAKRQKSKAFEPSNSGCVKTRGGLPQTVLFRLYQRAGDGAATNARGA